MRGRTLWQGGGGERCGEAGGSAGLPVHPLILGEPLSLLALKNATNFVALRDARELALLVILLNRPPQSSIETDRLDLKCARPEGGGGGEAPVGESGHAAATGQCSHVGQPYFFFTKCALSLRFILCVLLQ